MASAGKKQSGGGFERMGLSYPVFKGVQHKGFKVPTPIQRKCIPLVMDGKDVVAMARTGSGKTAAFVIPMLERLRIHSAKVGVRAVILSPTRELATQTWKFVRELGKHTDLRCSLVLGGDSLEDQFAAVHENPDIIVATPGRFLHLVVEMELSLSTVDYIVFDEADRLFEMGFAEQIRELIHRLPAERQTCLFSATLPKMLVEFAQAGLSDPTLVRLDVDTKLSENLRTQYLMVRRNEKAALLAFMLRDLVARKQQTVVFCATKHHVEYLRELLHIMGIECAHCYGNLDMTARKIEIAKFRVQKVMVLLVTDVAARGIDIPLLDCVINYDFPPKPKLFVHRVGRVARAGRSGVAFSFVSAGELSYLLDLMLFLGRSIVLKASSDEEDSVLGTVPQTLLDAQEETILSIHKESAELQGAHKTLVNAYKLYDKSKPLASAQSCARAKDVEGQLEFHPFFKEQMRESELQRELLVKNMSSYRPPQTIFEVNKSAKTMSTASIMRSKRKVHQGSIDKVKAHVLPASDAIAPPRVALEDSTTEDIQGAFSEILAPGRNKHGLIVQQQEESAEAFVPSRPADHSSERGLSLVDSFSREAASASVSLHGDEAKTWNSSKQQTKWDRKKKKFVSTGGSQEKRIRTESGGYIPASYKKDIYKEWTVKNKLDKPRSGEDESESKAIRLGGRGRKRGRGGHPISSSRNSSTDREHSSKRSHEDVGGDEQPAKRRRMGQAPQSSGDNKRRPGRGGLLRNSDQILKERRTKIREEQRSTQRGGGGGQRGGGRGQRGGGSGQRGRGTGRGGGRGGQRGRRS